MCVNVNIPGEIRLKQTSTGLKGKKGKKKKWYQKLVIHGLRIGEGRAWERNATIKLSTIDFLKVGV